MTKKVKVSFYLKRNETKKDGKSPVIARLSIGKFPKTIFSAKMTVPANLWASGRVTGKSHTANEIPLQILGHYRGTASGGRLLPMYPNGELNRELKNITPYLRYSPAAHLALLPA